MTAERVGVEEDDLEHSGLRRRAMSGVEVFAQSIANVGPSAVVATGPVLIAASAGNGTWLSYGIALIAVLIIGYCVSQFARRMASTGSLYTYTANGLGPIPGFLAGWGMLIGYLCIALICVTGSGLYFGSFLDSFGIGALGTGPQVVLYLIFTALAVLATIQGVQLSTRLSLLLEIISISAILVVLVVILADNGFSIDTSQFTLEGSSFNGITFGIVLAILGFVGFESSASLGAEARDPYRAIPRAVLTSALGAGLLYVLASYTMVLGFRDSGTALTDSGAPLNELATIAGVSWLGRIIDLGVTASFFAVVVASTNAGARMLFAMGHEGMASRALARTHPTHRTPHIALLTCAPLLALVPIAFVLSGTDPINVVGYVGTLGTFGYMLGYLLVGLATPVFLRRVGAPSVGGTIAGAVSALLMLWVFYKNVWPVPPSPYNRIPWVFLVLMLGGVGWLFAAMSRDRTLARRVGSFEEVADTALAP